MDDHASSAHEDMTETPSAFDYLRDLIERGVIAPPTNEARAHGFRPMTWRRWLNHDAAAMSVVDKFTIADERNTGRVTRSHLADLSRACETHDRTSLVRLFVATMLWGSGTSNGRGPRYTAAALGDGRLVWSLDKTRTMILHGNPGEAYTSFRSRGVGPAFFTKWFWAAGLDRGLRPTPLILDSRVWASLGELGWDSRQASGSRRWDVRYVAYLTSMEQWAAALPGVGTSERLEQMLFHWAGNPNPGPSVRQS